MGGRYEKTLLANVRERPLQGEGHMIAKSIGHLHMRNATFAGKAWAWRDMIGTLMILVDYKVMMLLFLKTTNPYYFGRELR